MRDKTHIPQLTGVRAAAAYAVYVYHFNPFDPGWLGGAPYRFVAELHVGVIFFYVLSGFLIYFNYGQRIRGLSLPFLAQYARNRFARIYPVYFLLLMATYLLLHAPPLKIALVHLTLTQGFFPAYLTSGIAQAWTLTVEETFYFSSPILFLMAARWTLAAPVAMVIAVGVILSIFTGRPDFIFARTLCGTIVAFAAGIMLAMKTLQHHHRLSERRRGPITSLSLAACATIVLAMSTLPATSLPTKTAQALSDLLLLVVLPLFIAMLYWGLMTEEGILARALSSRLAILLGSASYSFYLVHQGAIQQLFDHVVGPFNLVRFLFLNVVAVLLFEGFERPVNQRFKARPDGSRASALWSRWSTALLASIFLPFLIDGGCWLARQERPVASLVSSHRGDFLLAQGLVPAAVFQYERAVDRWPDNVAARRQLGTWRLSRGEPAEAIDHWATVVRWYPGDVQAHQRLGRSLMEAGRFDEAELSLRRAADLDPSQAESRNLLGALAQRRGQWGKAREFFAEAVRLAPTSADALSNLGISLAQMGRPAEARMMLKRALEIDPGHKIAAENLRILERTSRPFPRTDKQ